MLLIGDSTLLAVDRYNGYEPLRGFDYVYDAESCRTLGIPSCGDSPVPPNAVEAIGAADGNFDDVVIMAGYDEWWTSFPDSFDEVVEAARAKGARNIIWLTYPEGVEYKLLTGERADEAFIKNNQTLRDKVASGEYPDVRLAQWYPHTRDDNGWICARRHPPDGGRRLRCGRLHRPVGRPRRRAAVPDADRAGRRRRANVFEPRHAATDRRRQGALRHVSSALSPVISDAGRAAAGRRARR